MAFDREFHADHVEHAARISGHRDADLSRADKSTRGFDAEYPVTIAFNAGNLAFLDNIDSEVVGAPRKPPGHRVVSRGSAAWL